MNNFITQPWNSGYGLVPGGEPENRKTTPSWNDRRNKSPLRTHAFKPSADLIADETPTIFMTPAAYQKQCVYIDLAAKEVGWMGTVELLPSGDFLIEDTFLLEQQVTATETELSKDGIEKLCIEFLDNHPNGVAMVNKMRFWGHSHVYMGTGPSGTDNSTMRRIGAEGTGINWYIRGIFNKLGRAEFSLYLYELGYRINDVPWAVLDPQSGKIIKTKSRKSLLTPKPEKQTTTFAVKPSPATKDGAEQSGDESKTESVQSQDNARQAGAEQTGDTEKDLFEGIPAELTPSPELRRTIKREFGQKVKESAFAVWAGWDKEDEDADEQADNTAVVTVPAQAADQPVYEPPADGKPDAEADGDESGGTLSDKVKRTLRKIFF